MDGDGDAVCTLVLCGKSAAENEIAVAVKNGDGLKLPDNIEVSTLLQSEMNTAAKQDSFDVGLYMSLLSTNRLGRFLIWSPRLPSTNDVISHNFSELPTGAVCVGDLQFKGKGTLKNVWESPRGCLMFSFALRMEAGTKDVPFINYVVALAVTEAVKDVCDRNGLPYLDVRIKWPSYLDLTGLKVGGTMCNSIYKSKKFHITAGIGLNVDNKKPTPSLNSVLRDIFPGSNKLRREDIMATFFNKFEKLYDLFTDQGFKALEELYYGTWLHSGQRVVTLEKNGEEFVEDMVTVQGLTSLGKLLAIGDDNQEYELDPDGNRVDFFKGLVKTKL